MPEFIVRVARVTGKKYDPSTISLLERDKQQWRLADASVLSRVDPLRRGPGWLAFGERSGEAPDDVVDPTRDRRLTEEEEARAAATATLQRAAKQRAKGPAKKAAKKRRAPGERS